MALKTQSLSPQTPTVSKDKCLRDYTQPLQHYTSSLLVSEMSFGWLGPVLSVVLREGHTHTQMWWTGLRAVNVKPPCCYLSSERGSLEPMCRLNNEIWPIARGWEHATSHNNVLHSLDSHALNMTNDKGTARAALLVTSGPPTVMWGIYLNKRTRMLQLAVLWNFNVTSDWVYTQFENL